MTTLVVEITREGDKLKMSAFEKAKGIDVTIKHYSECSVSSQEIKTLCNSITHLFNKANRQHGQENDFVNELKKNGRALFDHLLTAEVKKVIQKSESKYLLISIDEQLVQIPWELLFDGEEFLCIRFAIGRTVRTKQKIYDNKLRGVNKPVKMLITADPIGDLDSAYQEGISIRNEMDKRKNKINVLSRTGDVSLDFIKKNIRDYDIVHFAGHAEYNTSNPSESGWILKDGIFTAKDIVDLGATASLPSIVFSNACQSGQMKEWEIEEGFEEKIYGVANAFLIAGVRHYIGTFWKVMDEPCYYFANEFYKNVIEGTPIGEAVRLARIQLINKYGYESIVWSSYMLYGDPSINLFFTPPARKIIKENILKKQIMILSFLLGSIIGTGLLGFILYRNYFMNSEFKINAPYIFKNTIAVMPFENLNRDKETDWLGYGFADVITDKLGTLNKICVTDRTNIDKIWTDIKTSQYVDKNTAIKIANFTGADKIIMGSYQKMGNNIRLIARLINTKDGTLIGSAESINTYDNLFILQDEIALKIPELLNIDISNREKLKLKNFVPTNKISAYELMVKSYQEYLKGNIESAKTLCEKALRIDPNYWAPNICLGLFYLDLGDVQKGEMFFEKSLKIAERQKNMQYIIESLHAMGLVLCKENKLKKAKEIFVKVLNMAHDNKALGKYAEISLRLAEIYMLSNEYENAKQVIDKSQKIFSQLGNYSGLVFAHRLLGNYYSAKKDYNTAQINYREALRLAEGMGLKIEVMFLYNNLGSCYWQAGNIEEAIIYFKKTIMICVKLNQDIYKVIRAYAYLHLAMYYEQKGQFGNAEFYYHKSMKLYKKLNKDMEYRKTLYLLGYMYMSQLRYDKAFRYFEIFVKKAKMDKDYIDIATALPLLGIICQKTGRFNDAINYYEELLKYKEILAADRERLLDLYLQLGICYGQLNNDNKMKEYFKYALNEAGITKKLFNLGYVYRNIGYFYMDRSKFSDALDYYTKAIYYFEKAQDTIGESDNRIFIKQNLFTAYYDIAEYYRKQNETDEATEYYKKALPIAEEVKSPLINYIKNCLSNMHILKWEEEQIIKDDISRNLYQQSIAYFGNGEYKKALEFALKAHEREPFNRNIINTLCLSYELLGNYDDAINMRLRYIKYLEKKEYTLEIVSQYDFIGYNYYLTGELSKSKEFYEKGISLAKSIENNESLYSIYAGYLNVLIGLNEYEKAMRIANEIISYFKERPIGIPLDIAYRSLSNIFIILGEKTKALEYAEKSMEVNELIGGIDLGYSYITMASCYTDIDIIKTVEYLNKANEFFKKHHDIGALGEVYFMIGDVYKKISQYDNAIENYKNSVHLVRNKWLLQKNYIALDEIYFKLKKYELSEEYRNKAIELLNESKDYKILSLYYFIIGMRYFDDGIDNEKGEQYILLSNSILDHIDDKNTLMGNLCILAMELCDKKEYEKSIKYLIGAMEIAKKLNNKVQLKGIYAFIIKCYFEIKDFEKAIFYAKKALLLAQECNDQKGEEDISKLIKSIEQNMVDK